MAEYKSIKDVSFEESNVNILLRGEMLNFIQKYEFYANRHNPGITAP
jgi:hypothetical protein